MKYSEYNTWYEITANEHPKFDAYKGDSIYDVCIVGGGIVGVTAAYNLARKGKKVALLESSSIGYGATGRSGAPLLSGFQVDIQDIEDIVGKSAAHDMWQMTINARDEMVDRIKKLKIDCAFTPGVVYVASTGARDQYLEDKYYHLSLKFPDDQMERLTTEDIQTVVNSSLYIGGVKYAGGGHFHPLNYLYGLAAEAVKAGAHIFEDSPVQMIDMSGAKSVAKLDNGELKATHMLICGNAYMRGVMPPQKNKTVTTNVYQFVSEPIPADAVKDMMPNREAAIDMRFVPEYYQITPDNRLLFGGPDQSSFKTTEALGESIVERIAEIFPQLPKVAPEHIWRGPVGVTMNFMPAFEQLNETTYMVHGFNGHGMVMSSLAGDILANAVLGDTEGFECFSRIRQKQMPQWLHHTIARLSLIYYRVKDLIFR